ncbi:hypothetical protein KSD_73800 [Ktedonobacter sp. SOSP1-85]|uniref:GNAT family N-acetyltransferase n=1 Tax=Ktedonobacter sp. SOSP1-85 TaxID=2778367 RepID=UPI001915A49B|nr:GNAT family N-acetyltransferase [Ktedonobacter sp. SOSP1-85]GHO79609.1 hypothetical protein KSD_73800 [Ktedonobacter sp. SOSP1-85]
MPKNLRTISEPALTDAVELNIQELSTLWGRALGARFYHEAEASWFTSNIPHWTGNWVTRTHFTAETSPERMDAVLERVRTTQQHETFWVVDASSPDSFLERIKRHGWQGGKPTVWALDVHTLADHYTFPEGVTVERVSTTNGLQEWANTFVTGYGDIPMSVYHRSAELIQQHGFVATPGVYYYLGRLNGEPVSTTLLFLGGGVSGIYCTATLPHARRRKVGTSVVMQCLLDTRAMGYHIATLQATAMGAPVYRALGFKEYETLNFYRLSEAVKE